jgi:hypothetical protein
MASSLGAATEITLAKILSAVSGGLPSSNLNCLSGGVSSDSNIPSFANIFQFSFSGQLAPGANIVANLSDASFSQTLWTYQFINPSATDTISLSCIYPFMARPMVATDKSVISINVSGVSGSALYYNFVGV